MKRVTGSFFAAVFLFCVWCMPALAADPSAEIEQLKGEVNKLLKRIDDLEKKQTETEIKAKEAEKKIIDVETKTVKIEKKSLKDRVELGGEARFRITSETAHTKEGFYGNGLTGESLSVPTASENKPTDDFKIHDETAFPTRIRLNAHVEVVPEIVDFYARLTMNKRWGTLDEFSLTDPFNRPNSFVSSIGRDVTPRFEQAYMTLKLPYDFTWYIGRLPGMDGPPSRQSRSLFPRLFIDSEIDGTLVKWDAPKTFLDNIELPWGGKLWGEYKEASNDKGPERKFASLEGYERKAKERSGIILGYLKYDERKISLPEDADVFLGQAELKIGKDTAIILNGLYMDDWHMPRTSFGTGERLTVFRQTGITSTREDIVVPDLKTPYHLLGGYADTQLFGLQIYGAYYWSHFSVPEHTVHWYTNGTTTDIRTPSTFEKEDFPGHMWYAGFNTGDLIGKNFQFCLEYAKGSDAWINPFNYRGFRRKGTVLQPANNYFYNPAGVSDVIIGFYPFNAGVWDSYFDYFFRPNVRFRVGVMDFIYNEHDHDNIQNVSVLGSSKFQNYWWP
ncbi:MAG TPA: DUF3373 family protein, partial [candidate division Zixibacteria bacterium]|nr:DUF3373 family protein [candidate division Zixibacteria bacterium]